MIRMIFFESIRSQTKTVALYSSSWFDYHFIIHVDSCFTKIVVANKPLIIQVIILSALVMMFGMMTHKTEKTKRKM